jgi:two-component system response regulator AtoC
MNRIVVADDDAGIARILSDRLRDAGHEVDVARDGVEALRLAEGADLLLLDLEMPRMDGLTVLDSLRSLPAAPLVIVITAHGDMAKAVRAMRAGAYDFIAKPFDSTTIQLVVQRALETRRLKAHVHSLRSELGRKHLWVRGSDPGMARIADMVERVAPSNATVLLLGETGTGKEVIARAVHLQSNRGDQPFLAVNCALLKGELLESELFGHEKGAFTGAARARAGRVETARGGTLFLDEIGEMSPALQAKLLRLLQEKEYERLGSDRTLKADVRVIGDAPGSGRRDTRRQLPRRPVLPPESHQHPDSAAARTGGRYLPLAEWLLEQHAAEAGRPTPKLTEEVRKAVLRYSWPGNVRELSNAMQRCALLAGDTVSLFDLSEELVGGVFSDAATVASTEDLFELPYN